MNQAGNGVGVIAEAPDPVRKQRVLGFFFSLSGRNVFQNDTKLLHTSPCRPAHGQNMTGGREGKSMPGGGYLVIELFYFSLQN